MRYKKNIKPVKLYEIEAQRLAIIRQAENIAKTLRDFIDLGISEVIFEGVAYFIDGNDNYARVKNETNTWEIFDDDELLDTAVVLDGWEQDAEGYTLAYVNRAE